MCLIVFLFGRQVAEKKETHDYRCLFRVCFLPKDFENMLKDDPIAFEYLYLQVCVCLRSKIC